MKIKVDTPFYDVSKGLAFTKLNSGSDNAYVTTDFRPLLASANIVSSDVLDFFVMSSAVYGIDRFVKRKRNSVDGWSRELEIEFPVHDVVKWNKVTSKLESLLSFLTGDYWSIKFYKGKFKIPKTLRLNSAVEYSKVSLFSGGLDSLIGSLDLLNTDKQNYNLFVSHYDPQMGGPKGDQKVLVEQLEKEYPNFKHFPSIKVTLESSTLNKEATFRSRSILFIGIALLLAQGHGISDIIVPENGSVSLNFPLSSSRRSACSTRTTHPTVLEYVKEIWKVLGIQANIGNPYELKTKGEMVNGCKDKITLKKVISISNSCGKRGHRAHWDIKDASHCGVCMPCIYRRASLLKFGDVTTYGNNINDFITFKTKMSQDVGACLEFLKVNMSTRDIRKELLVNGVKDLLMVGNYTNVVEKTRQELKQWFAANGGPTIKRKANI